MPDGPVADVDQQLIYQSTTFGMALYSPAGSVLDANDAAIRMLGVPEAASLDASVFGGGWAVAWEDGSPIQPGDDPVQTVVRSRRSELGKTVRVTGPNGHQRWLHVDAVPVKNSIGMLSCVVVSLADITDRVRAELEARKREEHFRAFFVQSPIGMLQLDLSGRIMLANDVACALFGYKHGDLIGTLLAGFRVDAETDDLQAKLGALMRGEEDAIQCDVQLMRADGTRAWAAVTLSLVRDSREQPASISAVVQDITIRKEEERRTRLFEAAVVHARDAVVITEVDRDRSRTSPVVYVNEAFTRLTGYESDEIVGRPSGILDGPETDSAAVAATYDALLAGVASQSELLTYRKDGSTYWADYRVVPIPDQLGCITHWISFERDTSARRAAEEALRASEDQLRTVLMNAPVILSSIDASGIFRLSAGGAQPRLGYGPDDRVGKSLYALFDEQSDVVAYFRRALAGESHTQSIEINGVLLDVRWVPQRDGEGRITGVISMGFDVSERARAQQESERARAAAEELAITRNDFVAAVSHELRTPLTAIIGYAELLEARWRTLDDARRHEQLRRIVAAANRQKRLVEDLLLLGRLDVGDLMPTMEPVLLAPVCELAADEVRGSYRDQEIRLYGSPAIQVSSDSGQLIQILVNLIDNAAKYSPEGSPVDVIWVLAEQGTEIRVRDHGSGISAEGIPRLFTRFGRVPGSKARNGRVGTGLGLYLGRLMAEAMGGTLEIESTGSDGTVFCLRLGSSN